jgi:hypothetical protein
MEGNPKQKDLALSCGDDIGIHPVVAEEEQSIVEVSQ